MINEKSFREYDIRGIAGKDIGKDTALALGKAFGAFLKSVNPNARSVSVGKDVRLSTEDFRTIILTPQL